MKLKLHRDKVITMSDSGKDIVGVYVMYYDLSKKWLEPTEILLAEMSPTKADKIIKLWNTK